jgi:hypothetical protein
MALFKSTLGGTTPDGRWSFSIWTTNTGDDAAAALSKFQDAVEAMWVDGLDAFIATAVTYDSQSVVTINQATGQQIARADGIVSNPGVATAGTLPPQISLAVTLRTALATRAGRGRIYLPPFSLDEVAAGRLGATTQGLALTAVKGMFDTMISDGHTPVLYGRSSHATTPVTQLALGDVYDTQRRRRDSYVESRVSTAV